MQQIKNYYQTSGFILFNYFFFVQYVIYYFFFFLLSYVIIYLNWVSTMQIT